MKNVRTIVNKYAKKCECCKRNVPVGEGFAYNDAGWKTVCSSEACFRKLDLPMPKAQEKGRITVDGKLFMPYNASALPLLRSLPGGKWNKPGNYREFSTNPGDLPRVIEIAEKLGLEIPNELRKKAAAGTPESREAELRAETSGLYDFQREGVRFLSLHDRALLADDMGTGKMQPVSAMVLTPTGWRTIGELCVGDFVIGSSGKPVKVTGVFPQGIKDVWEVTFSDGAVTCCGMEHLWAVQTPNDRVRNPNKLRVHSLQELVDQGLFDKNGNSKWFIPVVEPVEFEEQEFPLHPYLLGALLANGRFGNSISHSGDQEQRDAMSPYLPDGVSLVLMDESKPCDYRITHGNPGKENPVVSAIRNFSLNGYKSPEKFIPPEYLLGSISQRLNLLQGLVDNDGTVSEDGMVVEYNTTSEILADQVISLVRSLGGIALISTRIPKFTYKGQVKEGKKDHRIRIKLPAGLCPVTIPRKKGRFVAPSKYPVARSFQSVTQVADEESVCIMVDAEDHLYVTDDYICTHNTVQSLVALPNNVGVIIVAPASLKYNWRNEASKWRPDFKVTILAGRDSFKIPEANEIVITNYEILPKSLMPTKSAHTGKSEYLSDAQLQKQLENVVLIVDECFPFETIVATNVGPIKIGDIVENRLPLSVISYNKTTGRREYKPVIRWLKKPLATKMVRVIHEQGEFVCTENHKVWTEEEGYQAAIQLLGKTLQILPESFSAKTERETKSRQEKDGCFRSSRVVGVEVLERRGNGQLAGCAEENKFVYDLEVKDNHNYTANGVLVSNCHRTKNFKTAQSKKVSRLSRLASKVWFLTGTPLLNRPGDLFGVVCSGDMNVFGKWQSFASLFNGYQDQWGGWNFGEPSPEVAERLRRIMIRRLKKDVLKDLPPKTYQTITVNGMTKALEAKLRKIAIELAVENASDEETYEDIVARVDSDLENTLKTLGDDAMPRFEQFAAIRAELARSRIPAALEIVEEYEDSDTPLLVFSAHKEPINAIGSREGWAAITGDTPPKERQRIVDDFQSGKLKGVALTIIAGGVGLTLTRASHELFIDLDWTPALNLQAEDRANRIGQKADCVLIKRLESSHPLDQHVQNLIFEKMKMITAALEKQAHYEVTPISSAPNLTPETDEELAARLAALEAAQQEVERLASVDKVHGIIDRERARASLPEPKLTRKRKDLIRQALGFMVGRCDGAKSEDNMGFNKPDARIAHHVARTGMRDDDEVTFRVMERVLSRYYKTQLKGKFDGIWS